jgi:hypothetical protein
MKSERGLARPASMYLMLDCSDGVVLLLLLLLQ